MSWKQWLLVMALAALGACGMDLEEPGDVSSFEQDVRRLECTDDGRHAEVMALVNDQQGDGTGCMGQSCHASSRGPGTLLEAQLTAVDDGQVGPGRSCLNCHEGVGPLPKGDQLRDPLPAPGRP